MSVDNFDDNGDYFYINNSTGFVIKNNNSVRYKNKRDKISTNRYLRGNNELLDVVDIDYILPTSASNHYVHVEYNI